MLCSQSTLWDNGQKSIISVFMNNIAFLSVLLSHYWLSERLNTTSYYYNHSAQSAKPWTLHMAKPSPYGFNWCLRSVVWPCSDFFDCQHPQVIPLLRNKWENKDSFHSASSIQMHTLKEMTLYLGCRTRGDFQAQTHLSVTKNNSLPSICTDPLIWTLTGVPFSSPTSCELIMRTSN